MPVTTNSVMQVWAVQPATEVRSEVSAEECLWMTSSPCSVIFLAAVVAVALEVSVDSAVAVANSKDATVALISV